MECLVRTHFSNLDICLFLSISLKLGGLQSSSAAMSCHIAVCSAAQLKYITPNYAKSLRGGTGGGGAPLSGLTLGRAGTSGWGKPFCVAAAASSSLSLLGGGGGPSIPGLPKPALAATGNTATAPGGMLTGLVECPPPCCIWRSRLGGASGGAPASVSLFTTMLLMSRRGAGTGGVSVAADTPTGLELGTGGVALALWVGESAGEEPELLGLGRSFLGRGFGTGGLSWVADTRLSSLRLRGRFGGPVTSLTLKALTARGRGCVGEFSWGGGSLGVVAEIQLIWVSWVWVSISKQFRGDPQHTHQVVPVARSTMYSPGDALGTIGGGRAVLSLLLWDINFWMRASASSTLVACAPWDTLVGRLMWLICVKQK